MLRPSDAVTNIFEYCTAEAAKPFDIEPTRVECDEPSRPQSHLRSARPGASAHRAFPRGAGKALDAHDGRFESVGPATRPTETAEAFDVV